MCVCCTCMHICVCHKYKMVAMYINYWSPVVGGVIFPITAHVCKLLVSRIESSMVNDRLIGGIIWLGSAILILVIYTVLGHLHYQGQGQVISLHPTVSVDKTGTSNYSVCGRWLLVPALDICHGPLTRYIKLRVAHAPGMPGKFSPAIAV